MQVVPLSKATPGMKVARPVTDEAGNLLLREGFELTLPWIDRLRERGIVSVTIEAEHPTCGPLRRRYSGLQRS